MADATHARVALHALQGIALLGLSTTAACWVGDDCRETFNKKIEVSTPTTPQMQLLIDSCMVDSGACPNLCAALLNQESISTQPTKCIVAFASDKIVVDVSFDVYNTESSNCYIDMPPEPFPDAGIFPDGFRARAGSLALQLAVNG